MNIIKSMLISKLKESLLIVAGAFACFCHLSKHFSFESLNIIFGLLFMVFTLCGFFCYITGTLTSLKICRRILSTGIGLFYVYSINLLKLLNKKQVITVESEQLNKAILYIASISVIVIAVSFYSAITYDMHKITPFINICVAYMISTFILLILPTFLSLCILYFAFYYFKSYDYRLGIFVSCLFICTNIIFCRSYILYSPMFFLILFMTYRLGISLNTLENNYNNNREAFSGNHLAQNYLEIQVERITIMFLYDSYRVIKQILRIVITMMANNKQRARS